MHAPSSQRHQKKIALSCIENSPFPRDTPYLLHPFFVILKQLKIEQKYAAKQRKRKCRPPQFFMATIFQVW
jgi:hypothetical protein